MVLVLHKDTANIELEVWGQSGKSH